MCQALCWALEYKEAWRVWCPAVVSAFLGRTPSLPRGRAPPSTESWSAWKPHALLLPALSPHMHVTQAGQSEFCQRFRGSIAEGKGLDFSGVLTLNTWAWWLRLSFPSHAASLRQKAKLQGNAETASGTALRASLAPLDLALPEASRPVHLQQQEPTVALCYLAEANLFTVNRTRRSPGKSGHT